MTQLNFLEKMNEKKRVWQEKYEIRSDRILFKNESRDSSEIKRRLRLSQTINPLN